MLAISTCWKSAAAKSAADILNPLLDLGIKKIEAEYRITEDILKGMLPALKGGRLSVVSVHNFFPLPAVLKREEASGDAFLLSSLDRDERERAVRYTIRTLEWAHELGAEVTVLHLGKTGMDDGFEELREDGKEGRSGSDYVERVLDERRKISDRFLDAALFSLDKLWRPAERFGLKLGIENRYHLREIPDSDELDVILNRFQGSNIGYWHDVGHAAAQEFLYGLAQEELLARFSPHLIGVHLHDAERTEDHKAPGKGTVDFRMVKKYLTPTALSVLEVGPGAACDEIQEGMEMLVQQGYSLQ